MRLFRVTCRGMASSASGRVAHGVAYVVATNSDDAYQRVRADLDKRDIGLTNERELDKIELIAESCDYPDCGIRLFA